MFCVNEYQTAVKRQRWEPNSESLQNLNVLWMPFWDYWWQMRINALRFYLFVFFFFFNLHLKCSSGVRERFELCAYMLIPKPLAQGLLQGLLPASSFRNFTLVSFFWHPSCLYDFGLSVFGFDLVFPWDFASLCYKHWSHSGVFLFCLYILWVISNT